MSVHPSHPPADAAAPAPTSIADAASAVPLPGLPSGPPPPLTRGTGAVNVRAARDAVVRLLDALGVDRDEHTDGTPERVARAWAEALAGYGQDPREHLAVTFPAPPPAPVDGGGPRGGLVVVAGIRVVSTCAHHLLPIVGHATVAYLPRTGSNGPVGSRVVGLSKLARAVDVVARRLQVQERIGWEVVSAVMDALEPVGAACVITAEHGCMSVRGVAQHDARTTTWSLGGSWGMDSPEVTGPVAAAHERHVAT